MIIALLPGPFVGAQTKKATLEKTAPAPPAPPVRIQATLLS
jgi:hypothetical protein